MHFCTTLWRIPSFLSTGKSNGEECGIWFFTKQGMANPRPIWSGGSSTSAVLYCSIIRIRYFSNCHCFIGFYSSSSLSWSDNTPQSIPTINHQCPQRISMLQQELKPLPGRTKLLPKYSLLRGRDGGKRSIQLFVQKKEKKTTRSILWYCNWIGNTQVPLITEALDLSSFILWIISQLCLYFPYSNEKLLLVDYLCLLVVSCSFLFSFLWVRWWGVSNLA